MKSDALTLRHKIIYTLAYDIQKIDLLLSERSTERKAILGLLNFDVMNFGQNNSSKFIWQTLALILTTPYSANESKRVE